MSSKTGSNKTALITGASAGIGRAIAVELASQGYRLILLARREEKLAELQTQFAPGQAHLIVADINDRNTVSEALANLPQDFKDIDVLINNAGLSLGMAVADKADWNDWQLMIETNCLSMAFMTQQVLPNMVDRNCGHIINLGSTAGHYPYKGGNVYGASKAFVDQFSINLRTDLAGTNIRVCNLIPGLVGDTEFSVVRFHGDSDKAQAVYDGYAALTPQDIASNISWVLAQPAHININRMEIMPVCQTPACWSFEKSVPS